MSHLARLELAFGNAGGILTEQRDVGGSLSRLQGEVEHLHFGVAVTSRKSSHEYGWCST